MCKLIVAVKQPGRNPKFNELLYAQEDGLKTQPDGIGAVVIDAQNQVHIFREFKDYDKVFDAVWELVDVAKFVSVHTRIGTSGNKDLTNVHFFQDQNYVFAHNGFVNKYHSRKWEFNGANSTRHLYHGYHSHGTRNGMSGAFHGDDNGHWSPEFENSDEYFERMADKMEEARNCVTCNPQLAEINEKDWKDAEEQYYKKGITYVSEVVAECYLCATFVKLCSNHDKLPYFLIDDSAGFFKIADEEVEKIEKEMPAGTTASSRTEIAMERAAKIYAEQSKDKPKLTGDQVKARKKQKLDKKLLKEKNKEMDKYCDSFQFLKLIEKPITKESLDAEMTKTDFSGMAVMLNTETLQSFLMVKKPSKAVTDGKTFSAFFSFDPVTSFNVSTIRNVNGVDAVGLEEHKISNALLDLAHGVYEIKMMPTPEPQPQA